MADALREAYSDLFVLRAKPGEVDRGLIEGKFKSTHNVSDRVAKLMGNTLFSLLALADLEAAKPVVADAQPREEEAPSEAPALPPPAVIKPTVTNLPYNIQIHLPATKDIEVFNAIFKSLREHLIE